MIETQIADEKNLQLPEEEKEGDTPTFLRFGRLVAGNRLTQGMANVARTTIAVASAIPEVAIQGAAINRYNAKQLENQQRAAEKLNSLKEEREKEKLKKAGKPPFQTLLLLSSLF